MNTKQKKGKGRCERKGKPGRAKELSFENRKERLREERLAFMKQRGVEKKRERRS